MSLTFTLGQLLGISSPKPVDATSERYRGREYRKACGCGRGWIHYDYYKGSKVPRHTVWDEGFSFGQPTYAACCALCAAEEQDRLAAELEGEQ